MAKGPSDRFACANSPRLKGNENWLLAALPDADYDRIVPPLDVLPLKIRHILHQPRRPVRHIYFPRDGFCSQVTVLRNGRMIEVATIGREGAVGLLSGPDERPVASATMVQGPTSTSVRMPAAVFRVEMERRGPFFDLVSRYRLALVRFIMQSTACNVAHTVEERLARWLLTAQDHLRSDVFPLTQEFVAMMLGVTRPSVSVVASTLQRAGLITYRRGQVRVVDREQLLAAACECYAITEALVRRTTHLPAPRPSAR